MARARDPNRDKAFEIYKNSNGEILLKDIAEQLGKSDSQIRKWKNQDKWDDQLKGNVTNEKKKTKGNVTNRKKGGQPVNSNARGNSGNKNASPPKRNSNAEKHGFYKRVLPLELMEMFEEVESVISKADMLWDQIKLQYLAIMRSQSIMFVEDKHEMIKELKKFKPGEFGDEEEWNFQFAWERQAQFLNAQSRAISELRNSIKQFIETADEADKRRLELTQMQLNIDKTKAEIEKLDKPNDGPMEIIIKRKGDD